jgi:hypothetical protein
MATDGQIAGSYTNPDFTLNAQGQVIAITNGSGGGAPADVLTVNDDSGTFPSSYQLVAGSNVTFTHGSSPNTLIISATAGGGGVSSVTNSDGSLSISPTTGAVIASLNLAHANTWTGTQTFGNIAIYTSGTVQQVRVVTASGPIAVATSDYVIIVRKTTGAATTVDLPVSPTVGQTFVIKDGKGDAHTNNITLIPASGTIDGATTYVMNTNYASKEIIYTGVEWSVL